MDHIKRWLVNGQEAIQYGADYPDVAGGGSSARSRENSYVGSFHAQFCDELLDGENFDTVRDA